MRIIFIVMVALSLPINGQQLTGPELLEKAIAYHDPEGNWETFKGQFQVTMQTPKSSERVSTIAIDLPKQQFVLEVKKDEDQYTYSIERDSCGFSLNGNPSPTKEAIEKFRLSCDRGSMMRNYYTYLYGLPMKLKDEGTIVHDKVTQTTFKGKSYLVLKVTYSPKVGEDTWYFYFDPKTYAMQVYQFYHFESENDGEYILLSGMEKVNGIKMPKTRKWYYNENDEYLGVDVLN